MNAALATTAAGLAAAGVVAARTGDLRLGLAVAGDFLLAAGLLQLGRGGGWEPILVAAVVVTVRQVIARALRRGGQPPT